MSDVAIIDGGGANIVSLRYALERQLLADQALLGRRAVELGQEPVLGPAPAPATESAVVPPVMVRPMPSAAATCRSVPAPATPCRGPVVVTVALPRDEAGHGGGSYKKSQHVNLLCSPPRLGRRHCASAREPVKKCCGVPASMHFQNGGAATSISVAGTVVLAPGTWQFACRVGMSTVTNVNGGYCNINVLCF